MIYVVKNKSSKAPEDNYTVAVCDLCKATCDESRQPGREGLGTSEAADRAALGAGWVERTVGGKRGRKWVIIKQLVCPKCQATTPEPEAAP